MPQIPQIALPLVSAFRKLALKKINIFAHSQHVEILTLSAHFHSIIISLVSSLQANLSAWKFIQVSCRKYRHTSFLNQSQIMFPQIPKLNNLNICSRKVSNLIFLHLRWEENISIIPFNHQLRIYVHK